jgi:hypothetical protein
MKRGRTVVPLYFILAANLVCPPALRAQTCQDDEAMVENYRTDLTELVEKTRKETLEEFEKAFHQKICLTKLTLALGLTQELVSCLEKAAQDPQASKEQAAQDKTKGESYAKLRDTIDQDRKSLKGAEAPKEAKSAIGKFDFHP